MGYRQRQLYIPRWIKQSISFLGCLSLTSCSSMSGHVIPNQGPTMEQVYNGAGQRSVSPDLKGFQPMQSVMRPVKALQTTAHLTPRLKADGFRVVPNPVLTLYVYPHVAGQTAMPVPGYTTELTAYAQNHVMLSAAFQTVGRA